MTDAAVPQPDPAPTPPRRRGLGERVPLGLGRTKPKHYRDMIRVVWENRDNLGHAWDVLSKGVCDGCALGTSGLHDWTIPGTHLCMTRLNLLRLNTMPAFDPDRLADVSKLRGLSNRELRDMGRLAYPMLRRSGDGGFHRITWEQAMGRIAQRVRATDPRRLAFFLTSRGLTNETYYVAQKVARWLGTNNIDNAARLCHSPSTAAMKRTIGVGASTCGYRDWIGTDLLIFFGSNPANDQPVSMKYIDLAKRSGTRVVLVNPHHEPGMQRYWVPSTLRSAIFGTRITDEWVPVSQGGDIALLAGVIRTLIEEGGTDAGFIERHTRGFHELREWVISLDWPEIEAGAGLGREAIRRLARLIASAKSGVIVWSMGITQHRFGADAVQMILNLGLLRGWVGRDKCGLMPIRGHSGVQGGAEMGAYSTALPGGLPINPVTAARLSHQYGFAVPDEPGLQSVEMVEAARRGEIELLYCVGGNFLRTLPDPDRVAAAIGRVPLRVHQDILVSDQALIDPPLGGEVLLLPARTRYEQQGGGTETSTERRVIFSPEIPRQVGEARSEWRILLDLAHAVDPQRAQLLGCDTGPLIRSEIARIVPGYDGIQNLRRAGDQFQYGGPHLCPGGVFPMPEGRARLYAVPLPPRDLPKGALRLSSRRGKQFNTLIYAEVDPLTGAARDALLISPADAASRGLTRGQRVRVRSDHGQIEARIHPADLAAGNVQMHWPECNPLIGSGCCDPAGGVPDYNAVVWIETL